MKRIGTVALYLLWVLAVILVFAAPARAWGPGTHVETSQFILEHLVLLAPAIRKLLKAHPFAFIYGSVCPDMVLGKRFMRPERNNHRWEVGFSILEGAESPRQQSFAFGYLSHLAADTIAHNLYVPDQLLDHFSRRRRSHVMHELVFDSTIEDQVWALARQAANQPFPECDSLMLANLARTPLPARLNRRLFRSGMLLVRYGGWQRIIRALKNRWEGQIDEPAMTEYLRQVHATVLDFLREPESAPCLRHSPTGGHVLPQAETIKSMLKQMNRQSPLDPAAHQDIVSAFRRWREEAISGNNQS